MQRTVVLVEGASDQVAALTLAARLLVDALDLLVGAIPGGH